MELWVGQLTNTKLYIRAHFFLTNKTLNTKKTKNIENSPVRVMASALEVLRNMK